jgi:hypothetical protein
MKCSVLASILLFPLLLSAQSGAGIIERTYRPNPNVDALDREFLDLRILLADDKGRSLTSQRTLTPDEYALWTSEGEARSLLLMRIYDAGLADLERAIAEQKAVGKESVDRRRVQFFVAYDDILKFRLANAAVQRTDQRLRQLRTSIETMAREAEALEAQQQEMRRQLFPADLMGPESSTTPGKDIAERLSNIWELASKGPQSRSAVPDLVRNILDPRETPSIRMSALAAVGHVGVDVSMASRIVEVIRRDSRVFGGSGSAGIGNGGFELNFEGGTALPPGSVTIRGWISSVGVVGFQDQVVRPGGSVAVELGPRDPPGCISQAVMTTPGRAYELRFFTATGRDFQFNSQLSVRVADVARTIPAPVGSVFELVRIPFNASFPLTTVTFCAVGSQGFGPFIDDVSIGPQ